MAIMIGDERFEDRYAAGLAVIERSELYDYDIDEWRQPEPNYIGHVYATEVTETYKWFTGVHYDGFGHPMSDYRHVQVSYGFDDDETIDEDGEPIDPDLWPWDNGSLAVIVDGDFVKEVE